MATSEKIILYDCLHSKIPGFSKRKAVLLYVELTPTQLHIFEAVTAIARDAPFSSLQPSSATISNFTKGEQIRSLWRYNGEVNLMKSVQKVTQPGRRSHMYKFHIQKPDGLYKFKMEDQKRRNVWVEELLAPSAAYEQNMDTFSTDIGLDPHVIDHVPPANIPTIEYTHESSYPHYTPTGRTSGAEPVSWLEPVKMEGGNGHPSLIRQMSSDSDFPRSRSASFYSDRGGTSESGYSSGDFNGDSKSPSRSTSCDNMLSEEPSPPLSPTDDFDTATRLNVPQPQAKLVGEPREAGKHSNDKVHLSELGKLTQRYDFGINLVDSKCLSPVPEENEDNDLSNQQDLEPVVYLLKKALEFTVTHEGTVISLLEELGIIIDVPPGAISGGHPDEVTVKINACIKGTFYLPEGYEFVSPVFLIEPGINFAEKPIELSIVHFLDVEEEACDDLKFVSAPFDATNSDVAKRMVKFKNLDGGNFKPGGRLGKIALQHFCYIGVAKEKKINKRKTEGDLNTEETPIKRRMLRQNKERYIALLYYPLSFPVQPPRRYYVIFSISLEHPMYIKNLDKQLAERFSGATDYKLWRTSCKVQYAEDEIELEIPHEVLEEAGYEVHTDLGCVISKENVDNIRRSRLSKSDYANYIDYPPRILMTVQQTGVNKTHCSPGHPQLKLKGTLPESCFNLPLPLPDASCSTLSPTPTSEKSHRELSFVDYHSPSRMQPRTLVSLRKEQSLDSVPDLRDLGEKVIPHVLSKWYHIGIQLGLQPATLEAIERGHPIDVRRQCGEMFREWISTSEGNPTWRTLIEVLRGKSIAERRLANELEESFR